MLGEIEMANHEGTCRYCGNIQPVLAVDQIDADGKISEKCECSGYQKEQRYKRAADYIEKICDTDCANRGIQALPREVIDGACRMAILINEDLIDNVSIKVGGAKISLAMTSTDKIKVSRTDSENITREA